MGWLGPRGTALYAAIVLAAPLQAQITIPAQDAPGWVDHFAVLAGNATLGALTAGILQELRGGSFADGFARGAFGGSLVFAGKRVSAERFWGAGLAGREIVAVGTSVVRNASRGRPSFERLVLPVGMAPLWLSLDWRAGLAVAPRFDVVAATWLGSHLTDGRLSLNLGNSLSAGAPVFDAERRMILAGDETAQGVMVGRTIVLSDPATGLPRDRDQTLAHERVHVLQSDFALGVWSSALADWLLPRLPGGAVLNRYMAIDVHQVIPWLWPEGLDNPWEREAEFFAGARRP